MEDNALMWGLRLLDGRSINRDQRRSICPVLISGDERGRARLIIFQPVPFTMENIRHYSKKRRRRVLAPPGFRIQTTVMVSD
jgi:hypothetical protein